MCSGALANPLGFAQTTSTPLFAHSGHPLTSFP